MHRLCLEVIFRQKFIHTLHDCVFSESDPVCRTNISLAGNTVNMSDDIEIECSVRYRGIWSPVFICADHLPGTTINQTSSDHVLYTRLIPASNIQQFTQLSCSMTFTLVNDYQSISPGEITPKPVKPVYDFFWNTSAIRVVHSTGKNPERFVLFVFCALPEFRINIL